MEKQFLKQRSDFEKSCVERDKKYHFPQGVIFEADLAYAKDKNKAHRLDRYRPKGKETQILPVIINVHGGGLLLGNKEFNKYFCALLSRRDFWCTAWSTGSSRTVHFLISCVTSFLQWIL